jgi:hypothetical protein
MFKTIFANDVRNTLDLFRRSMDQFFDGFDASSRAISDGSERP